VGARANRVLKTKILQVIRLASDKSIAELSEQTLLAILNLQQRLIEGVDAATALELLVFQEFGETDSTESDLEQLQNIRYRLADPYSRLCTLLLRIAEFQPMASTAMLNLLEQTIKVGQAAADTAQANVQEIKRDWSL
jgi:hypothetical protein